jgi:hypothetical protein
MRNYLGISPSGPTVFRNVRKDEAGEPLILLDENAITKLRVNFADWIETPETITSATTTAEGCTATQALTSPNLDLTISATTNSRDGKITILAASSTGEVWRGVIRVRRTARMNEDQTRYDYA